MPTPPLPSATPEELLAESQTRLAASEEAFRQANLHAAAPLAFDALRAALSAAMLRHSIPVSGKPSVLSDAEALARAAKLDCLATKIAPLLCLGLDRRDSTRDPARLSRLLPAAHEITRSLQALGEAPARPAGGEKSREP